jgi:hypothetical protein
MVTGKTYTETCKCKSCRGDYYGEEEPMNKVDFDLKENARLRLQLGMGLMPEQEKFRKELEAENEVPRLAQA